MVYYRIVNTDNYGGDYPNESWATDFRFKSKSNAQDAANAMQADIGGNSASRYFRVVGDDYKLDTTTFEP